MSAAEPTWCRPKGKGSRLERVASAVENGKKTCLPHWRSLFEMKLHFASTLASQTTHVFIYSRPPHSTCTRLRPPSQIRGKDALLIPFSAGEPRYSTRALCILSECLGGPAVCSALCMSGRLKIARLATRGRGNAAPYLQTESEKESERPLLESVKTIMQRDTSEMRSRSLGNRPRARG